MLDRLPNHLPTDRPVALLVRHAERPPLTDGDPGWTVGLTDQGRRDAHAFGAALGNRIATAHANSFVRCMETATLILEGAGHTRSPVEDPGIGMPGNFLTPGPEADESLRTLGFSGFNAHVMSGDRELPGLPHPGIGARKVRDHVLKALTTTPRLHLFVTHDVVIAAVLARSWQEMLDHARWWPRFLETAALWFDGASPMLSYRDACRPI